MSLPEQTLHSSPHLPPSNSVRRMMFLVILALIPGMLAQVHFFGWGVVVNLILAVVTALGAEALMLRLRRRAILPFLSDGSALLTGLLLGLALPTLSPWWLIVIGAAFALIVAKHLYGGLGYNPFNPAMVGYAMLLVAFPREMTAWQPIGGDSLGFLDQWRYTLTGSLPPGLDYDTLTAATPLDTLRTALGMDLTLNEIFAKYEHLVSPFGGRGWEWVNLWYALGGLALVALRVISWRIPAAVILTLTLVATLFALPDPDLRPSPWFHLFTGATMLGAFFIATDPVTAATTPRGQLIYGAGIAILIYVIRTWGGYPDAVAFSVLLMNLATPTIDYYTTPRVFGEERRGS